LEIKHGIVAEYAFVTIAGETVFGNNPSANFPIFNDQFSMNFQIYEFSIEN